MRSAFLKDIFREIGRSKSRFLSIFAIIALGAGFFSGLKASCPDMLATQQQYFMDQNLMDIRLVSTYGFSDKDMEAIRAMDGLRGIYPTYSKDVFVENNNNTNVIAKLIALPDDSTAGYADGSINSPVVLEGRLPENPGECVVEKHAQLRTTFEIGETVTVFTTDPDDPIEDSLVRTSWTVVGIVMSPQYISYERGNTAIGDGSIDTYIMIPESNFSYEVYTDVYLTFDSTAGAKAFTDEYNSAAEAETARFEALADVREAERFDEIKAEADEKIADARKELEDGEKEANEELADAKQELDDAYAELTDAEKEIADGWKEYRDGQREYADGKAEFEQKIADAKEEIASAEDELAAGWSQYRDGVAEYEAGRREFDDALAASGMTMEMVFAQKTALEQQAAELQSTIDYIEANGLTEVMANEYQAAKAGLAQINAGLDRINQTISAYETLEAAEKELDSAYLELRSGAKELENAKKELADAEKEGGQELADAAQELYDAYHELLDAEQEVADGWEEYYEGLADYEDGKLEADEEIADAKAELADAEAELADLKKPVWYVFTRGDNPGYSTYESDAHRIESVCKVFPVFFFMVAILVCLTTMTRMVEEERTQIGTMKALGYGKAAIAAKYIVYSSLASISGAVVGIAAGSYIFPTVIYSAYEMMYKTPSLKLVPMPGVWAAVTLCCLLCTTLAVIMACMTELHSVPAALMRPKAPKAGKRVLLERVTFIWKRLSFTYKVTVRNLFRYKKRIFMTILGIAGCTALTLTGFGLYSSISVILEKQYSEIFNYDLIIALDSDAGSAAAGEVMTELSENDDYIKNLELYMKSVDYKGIGDVSLMVPENTETLSEMIQLKDRVTGEKYKLTEDGVIITERFSQLSGLSAGDEFTFICGDNRFDVKIDAVTENYTLHFIYMTKELYEEICGAAPEYNAVFTLLADNSQEARDVTASSLMEMDGVQALSFVSTTKASFRDTVENLNYVVLLIIFSAAMLAFVVLYNLTNINITERIREIATIKVLGFYDGEVSAYVFRENVILTLIGDAIGIGLGVWLHKFVINVAQTDSVMFGCDLPLWCFAAAFVMTVIFALLVDFLMFFRLKKVSMVESLKSVE